MNNNNNNNMSGKRDDQPYDPLGLGRNVRTTIIKTTTTTTKTQKQYPSFVCNCLSCGKVYDCRRHSNNGQEEKQDTMWSYSCQDPATVSSFLSNGGVCLVCGTLVERAAKELGVVDGELSTNDEHEVAAYALRDTLVAFDRDAAARTTVIDDQNEYYDIDANAWLSDDEREGMREKMKEEELSGKQQGMTVTFDMLGRRCLIEQEDSSDARDHPSLVDKKLIETAMKDHPYGGGRAAVSAGFVESLTERFGEVSTGGYHLTYRRV